MLGQVQALTHEAFGFVLRFVEPLHDAILLAAFTISERA